MIRLRKAYGAQLHVVGSEAGEEVDCVGGSESEQDECDDESLVSSTTSLPAELCD